MKILLVFLVSLFSLSSFASMEEYRQCVETSTRAVSAIPSVKQFRKQLTDEISIAARSDELTKLDELQAELLNFSSEIGLAIRIPCARLYKRH